MLKIFTLTFSAIGFFTVGAQSIHNNRCEVTRTEDVDQFENWIYSKQIGSAGKSASAHRISASTFRIPVVVHVLHMGETVGEGFNYSTKRIDSQIRTLNEDFRRKKGTPGFNTHPDSEDAQIEFVLAQIDPEGNPTDGIVRVDMNSGNPAPLPPGVGDIITLCSAYSYWNPEQYLNIWCMDIGLAGGIFFGSARFPLSDLEGLPTLSEDGDGVFINALNFGQGETNTLPNYDMGRTLTHEMGHFLGLLHTFGAPGNCNYSDYCDDTPPISSGTNGCPSEKPVACGGRPAMIENYMDYSYDKCMNIFTEDQIARMHIALENSPRRKSLLTSPAIDRSEEEVTGIPYDIVHAIKVYPNPAKDKLYFSADEKLLIHDIKVTAHTLLGTLLFEKNFKISASEFEVLLPDIGDKIIILTIQESGSSHKQLIVIN